MKYSYRGCIISINHLQFVDGLWKGEAVITSGLRSAVTEDRKIFIDVGASDEKMAYLTAQHYCNTWVDENINE